MTDLARIMGTLDETLQDPDSVDCGFFACYALMILETKKATCREHRFCQRDVYVMREKFRGKTPSPLDTLEKTPDTSLGRGQCITTPQAARSFLSDTLRVKGYRAFDRATSGEYSVRLSDHKTAQEILRRNVNVLSNPAGILMALGYNHWIAILGKLNTDANATVLWYDPSLGTNTGSISFIASEFVKAGTILMRGLPPGHG